MKRPCVRSMVTGEDNISGDVASERAVRNTKMARGRVLEISRNNMGSLYDGNEVAQEENEQCSQELLRPTSLSVCPPFP